MGESGKWEEKYISWKAYLWKDIYSEEPYNMLAEILWGGSWENTGKEWKVQENGEREILHIELPAIHSIKTYTAGCCMAP